MPQPTVHSAKETDKSTLKGAGHVAEKAQYWFPNHTGRALTAWVRVESRRSDVISVVAPAGLVPYHQAHPNQLGIWIVQP